MLMLVVPLVVGEVLPGLFRPRSGPSTGRLGRDGRRPRGRSRGRSRRAHAPGRGEGRAPVEESVPVPPEVDLDALESMTKTPVGLHYWSASLFGL